MADNTPARRAASRYRRDCVGTRFRLKPAGVAALASIPLVLLAGGGIGSFSAPVMVVALGLAGLIVLSFLFLLAQLPSALRHAGRRGDHSGAAGDQVTAGVPGSGSLPPIMRLAEPVVLEADPHRAAFHPGIRFSTCWRLEFGPFRAVLRVPLVRKGPSDGYAVIDRRGAWSGCRFLELADPFGLFAWEVYDGHRCRTAVPPESRELAGRGESGRPAYDSASAPRPKEDAEDLLERRDYRPGDDTRKLDWKQLARTGDMLVRIGDDTVPLKGRIWIDVPAHPSGRKSAKRVFRRLDRQLETVDSLVRKLRESGQEVVVRLSGEDGWKSADDESWPLRLAASLPAGTDSSLPPAGERLWLICSPESPETGVRAAAAGTSGLAVTLAFPAPLENQPPLTIGYFLRGRPVDDRKRLEARRYRRILSLAVDDALEEGLDVRLL